MKLNDFLTEVHYRDVYPPAFEEFRKKWNKLVRERSPSTMGMYVQFTNHKDNTLDRTAHQDPGHSDPVGVYAYPLEYVINHPADIWYGMSAKYMRLIKLTSKHVLYLNDMSDGKIEHTLYRMGFTWEQIQSGLKTARKYKSRVNGPNKNIKAFMTMIQCDLSDPKGTGTGSRPEHPVRSGIDQTKLFLKAGYNVIQDSSANERQAIISPAEPAQTIFLNRAGFTVEEVISLRVGADDQESFLVKRDHKEHSRPFAQSIAQILGDDLLGKHSTEAANGIAFWTKKGRRIDVNYRDTDADRETRKKHRQFRLHDAFEVEVEIQTELGKIHEKWHPSTEYDDIRRDIWKKWHELTKRGDVDANWKPGSKKDHEEQIAQRREAMNQTHRDRMAAEKLSQWPHTLQAIQRTAAHFGLTYTTPSDPEVQLEVMEFCFYVELSMRDEAKKAQAENRQWDFNHIWETASKLTNHPDMLKDPAIAGLKPILYQLYRTVGHGTDRQMAGITHTSTKLSQQKAA